MKPSDSPSRRRFALPSWARIVLFAAIGLFAAHIGQGTTPTASAQGARDAFLDRVVASLTPDERVGQLVMVNFVGDDVSASSDIATLVRDYKVGAVLVTSSNGNVVNRDDTAGQLAALSNGLQQRAFETTRRSDAGSEYYLPLMIATDNEGDLFPFTNVTHGFTQVPNNMTIGATWSKRHAEATGGIIGKELSAAGINMLLGPVVDVLDTPRSGGNGDIGIRSFGGDPTWVGELGRAYVRGVHAGSAGRMITVAKHFPGHGASDRGTDNEVPTVNKSLEQLRASELAPFAEVGRSDSDDPLGVTDALMVSHIRYRNFLTSPSTPFTRPISLDSVALKSLLALPEFASWQSSHMVMSDSLGVPAVRKWYAQQEGQPDFPNRTVVRDALLAGSDLLPLVEFYRDPDHRGWKDNQLPTIEDSIIYMRQQYASDQDFRRRADEAVRRVVSTKLKLYPKLKLDEVLVDAGHATAVAGGGADEMRSLAEDALTMIEPQSVDGLRARLPRGPVAPDKVVIVECWDDCYPYRVKSKLDLQDRLLALYGPAGKARLHPSDVTTISFGELDAWLTKPDDPANAPIGNAIRDASWLILGLAEYSGNGHTGAVKRLLDTSAVDFRNKNVVAISYNVPYHLDSTEVSKLSAYFVVYNKTDAAIDTGFRALFGDATPKGHSPVDVGATSYRIKDVIQPDPDRPFAVTVFGQDARDVSESRTLALVAGPVLDRNGSSVPDGTSVTFALAKSDAPPATATGKTRDGFAGAQVALNGAGSYEATASVAGGASKPLAINVAAKVVPQATAAATVEPEPMATVSGAGGRSRPLLALAIGAPLAFALVVLAGVWFLLRRRRRARAQPLASAAVVPNANGLAPVTTAVPVAALPALLRVDTDTRRVYVKGSEARPSFSNDQFRLLSFLYERSGKVVGRELLVQHVWPDVHAEGVSEEALDALVRRVRERIVQAGGERSYIVTLRGQGFRLDIERSEDGA